MIQQDNRIAEYSALESRTQNDSNVAYNLITALIGFSVASFSIIGALLSLSGNIDERDKLFIPFFLIAIVSVSALIFGSLIQERFNKAGKMRIARAIQLEKELQYFSFRLFPPWNENPDDYQKRPDGKYLVVLGSFVSQKCPEELGVEKCQKMGEGFRNRFQSEKRVTTLYNYFVLLIGIVWIFFLSWIGKFDINISASAIIIAIIVIAWFAIMYLLIHHDHFFVRKFLRKNS